MDLAAYIIVSCSQIVLILVGVYCVSFLREDAKNTSLLNHISEFTRKTELVRAQFNNELEQFRSKLDFLTNKQNILFSESKDAVIEHLTNITNWQNDLSPALHEYNLINYGSIGDLVARIESSRHATASSSSKIQLLIEDNDVNKASGDAVVEILRTHLYVESCLKKMHRILNSSKHNLDQVSSMDVKLWSLPDDQKNFIIDRMRKDEKEREELEAEFQIKSHELSMNAIAKRNVFLVLAKQYIKQGMS